MKYELPTPGPQVTLPEIVKLEAAIGHRLPKAYVDFLLATNGGSSNRHTFKNHDLDVTMARFFGMRGDRHVEDLLWRRSLVADRLDTARYLPIAETSGGDGICLDLETGKIVFWPHEQENEEPRADIVQLLAPDFARFWASLTFVTEPAECDFSVWRSLGIEWRSAYGRSVCECAAMKGHLQIVKEWLAQHYPLGDSMRFAAMNRRWEVVDFLMTQNFDINMVDEKGRTPLDWSSWNENAVSGLRARGAKLASELKM